MEPIYARRLTKAEMDEIRRAMRDEDSLGRKVFALLRKMARRIPFAHDVAAAWFCAIDPATPRRVRLILMGALAYFVMPMDAIADFLPLVGFTDDAAVMAAAIATVAGSITPNHRKKADEALAE
jgi:uncharacterized membrane protein YkvA (DUF1232 family)